MDQKVFEHNICGKDDFGNGKCRLEVSYGDADHGTEYRQEFGIVELAVTRIPPLVEVHITFRQCGMQEITDLYNVLRKNDKLMASDPGAVPDPDKALYFDFSTASDIYGDGMLLAAAPVCWALHADTPESRPKEFRLIFDQANVAFMDPDEIEQEQERYLHEMELREDEERRKRTQNNKTDAIVQDDASILTDIPNNAETNEDDGTEETYLQKYARAAADQKAGREAHFPTVPAAAPYTPSFERNKKHEGDFAWNKVDWGDVEQEEADAVMGISKKQQDNEDAEDPLS